MNKVQQTKFCARKMLCEADGLQFFFLQAPTLFASMEQF